MSKTKAIILTAFVLALGAGVALGMLGSRALPQNATGRARFVEELQLTPEQEAKMEAIWKDMMTTRMRAFGDEFRSIQQQREAAIQAMLDPQQKAQYEQLNRQSFQRTQELMKRGQQDFEASTQKTREMLNDWQKRKFDELISKFQSAMPKDGGAGMWGMPMTPPTTAPAQTPQ